jgi:hypothetical protein
MHYILRIAQLAGIFCLRAGVVLQADPLISGGIGYLRSGKHMDEDQIKTGEDLVHFAERYNLSKADLELAMDISNRTVYDYFELGGKPLPKNAVSKFKLGALSIYIDKRDALFNRGGEVEYDVLLAANSKISEIKEILNTVIEKIGKGAVDEAFIINAKEAEIPYFDDSVTEESNPGFLANLNRKYAQAGIINACRINGFGVHLFTSEPSKTRVMAIPVDDAQSLILCFRTIKKKNESYYFSSIEKILLETRVRLRTLLA